MRHVTPIVLGALLAACREPAVCQQGAMPTGLVVRVVDAMGPAKQQLRAGSYAFTVMTEFGALKWSCTVAPAADDGTACATEQGLYAEDNAQALLLSAYVDDGGLALAFELIESNKWSGPEDVDIEIARDGEVVADEHYAPKYERSLAAVGKGCPQFYAATGEPPKIAL